MSWLRSADVALRRGGLLGAVQGALHLKASTVWQVEESREVVPQECVNGRLVLEQHEAEAAVVTAHVTTVALQPGSFHRAAAAEHSTEPLSVHILRHAADEDLPALPWAVAAVDVWLGSLGG